MQTVALLAALIAGAVAELWNPPPYRRWPFLTLGIAVLTSAVFALQSARPDLVPLLTRNPTMLASGEVWRTLTALFVQDGGTRQLILNQFWLLVLGTAAERRFSRPAWLAIYVGGGMFAGALVAGWEARDSGNLIACLALAGALSSDWRVGRGRWWRAGCGIGGGVAAFLLLTENDARGIGFFVGLAIGFALAARAARRERGVRRSADVFSLLDLKNGNDTLQ